MLIQFTTSNFRSFSEAKTLSMEATAITDFPENVFHHKRLKLLHCAVLYGANASGKSNFIRAISMMKKIISDSFQKSSTSTLAYDPFLLKTEYANAPSFFEVVFSLEDVRYRYGFEADQRKITGEWLFETEKIKERMLFVRVDDGIEVTSRFKEGIGLEKKTRDNALFLTVVDQFNGTKSRKVMNWFNNFNVIDGIGHSDYRGITFKMLNDESTHSLLSEYYRQLDLGFEDIKIKEELFDSNKLVAGLPEDLLKQIMTDLEGETVISLMTTHPIFDENNQATGIVEFDVRKQESSGTNKIIDLSGPIFDTLNDGGVLVVDELDAKLHPLLTLSIIRLFQNDKINTQNAQLIFATHSTSTLGLGRLRRDQIYFTEKDKYGASDLYSLVEYNMQGKKVRKDNSFEKDYIHGRYGAIPFIGNLNNLKLEWQEK